MVVGRAINLECFCVVLVRICESESEAFVLHGVRLMCLLAGAERMRIASGLQNKQ